MTIRKTILPSFDTMWNGIKMLAEKIDEGIRQADQDVVVKVYSLAKTDVYDIITEVFKAFGKVIAKL